MPRAGQTTYTLSPHWRNSSTGRSRLETECSLLASLCMYICIHVYIYAYKHIHTLVAIPAFVRNNLNSKQQDSTCPQLQQYTRDVSKQSGQPCPQECVGHGAEHPHDSRPVEAQGLFLQVHLMPSRIVLWICTARIAAWHALPRPTRSGTAQTSRR